MNIYRILLSSLLAGNVLLRFFTNEINMLPRIFNVWDVVVTFALAGCSLFVGPTLPPLQDRSKILRRLLLFNVIGLVGSFLNSDHIYPMAVVSQLVMWNEPILLFLAVIHLPFSLTDIAKFRRLMLVLIGFEIAIGLMQIPSFLKTGASEAIIGTFRGNAEQYEFFILIGLFWLLAAIEVRPSSKGWRILSIIGLLVLVVLIDNKASWIALALTLAIFMPKLPGVRGNISGKFKSYAALSALLLVGYYTVKETSDTASGKFGNLANAIESGNVLNIGKIKAVRDVADAYFRYPHMALVGSGLGTFYGRASFQYFPFHIFETIVNAPVGGYSEGALETAGSASASMAGVLEPVYGIPAFYKQFFEYEKIFAVGSGTADLPASSYISLLGETGLIGTALYLSLYFSALRRVNEALHACAHEVSIFPFIAATFATLVYLMFMGGYNFWLDCGRVNTIVWSMLGLSWRYVALQQQQEQEMFSDSQEMDSNFQFAKE